MKPKLVDDWKRAYRWASMWFSVALALWLGTPEATQARVLELLNVPPNMIPGLLLAGIVLGRVWKQQP